MNHEDYSSIADFEDLEGFEGFMKYLVRALPLATQIQTMTTKNLMLRIIMKECQRIQMKITTGIKNITAMKYLPRFMFKFTVVLRIIQTENKKIM